MKWAQPPAIKVYEALGSIADERIELSPDKKSAKLYSSTRNKYYDITYDKEAHAIMCNDNASFYVGTLGYPAIAYLMVVGELSYSKEFATSLKGIT